MDEQTSTSYANAYSWAHNPATGTSRCEIAQACRLF